MPRLEDVIALVDKGKLAQAKKMCLKLLKRNPNEFDARHLLGIIELREKKYTSAARELKRALFLDPGAAPVINNLGVAHTSMEKHRDALAYYRRAAARDATSYDFSLNLARCLERCGYWNESIRAYVNSKKLRNAPELSVPLARLNRLIGEYDLALDHIENYLQIDPFNTEALTEKAMSVDLKFGGQAVVDMYGSLSEKAPENSALRCRKAEAWRYIGLKEEAIQENLKLLDVDPYEAKAMCELSGLGYYKTEEQIVKLQSQLASPELHSESDRDATSLKVNSSHTLYRAFENLGEFVKAGDALVTANNAYRSLISYDAAGDDVLFRRMRDVFSRPDDLGQFISGDVTPIFIVGMPRSGTSLVEQILSRHSDVFAAGELETLPRLLRAEGAKIEYLNLIADGDAGRLKDIARSYLQILLAYGNSPYVTDKFPGNFVNIGFIRTLFPNAKIVHCTRDPVDTCFSCYTKFFLGDIRFAYDQSELGKYYLGYLDLMEFWRDRYGDAIIEVNYESMVADHVGEARQLLKALGLEWEDGVERFYESSRSVKTASSLQVKEKIYRSSVDSWKPYEMHITELLECLKKRP